MSSLQNDDRTVSKYLSRYGESESQQLIDFPDGFDQGLVIPLYREDYSVFERFKQFACDNPKTLLIFIINRPETDNDVSWSSPFFEQISNIYWRSLDGGMSLARLTPTRETDSTHSSVLVVDRCVRGAAIPKDQGVGLARKVGADILCALIYHQKVKCPWIFNTDADAHLPADYFSVVQHSDSVVRHSEKNCAALVYPFKHCFIGTNIEKLPTQLYEFSLHYYVEGLKYAGSPYAYHTLGSTIAVNHLAYSKVRGFPKRAAAEDFYLLNKLAKTGTITSLSQPLIRLTARESNRVPFGTGPGVINLAAMSTPTKMALYHPSSFCYLQVFIQLLDALSDHQNNVDIAMVSQKIIDKHAQPTLHNHYLLAAAQHINLQAALDHSYRHGNRKATRLQQLHHWFDGFRTLKFIHFLRDQFLGTTTFQQWATEQPPESNLHLSKLVNQILVTASQCEDGSSNTAN
jgi:hypothetical protein